MGDDLVTRLGQTVKFFEGLPQINSEGIRRQLKDLVDPYKLTSEESGGDLYKGLREFYEDVNKAVDKGDHSMNQAGALSKLGDIRRDYL